MEEFTPQQWRRAFELMDEALDLPAEARAQWLRTLSAEAHEPSRLVRDLLARQALVETSDFLAHLPKLDKLDLTPAEGVAALRPGDHVGAYRLLRELGAGGMAIVWLAERADGAFQRQVALKLPRIGWAGGFTERLARERSILAALEHPNIARLYDAGLDALGRPYMAMEYIDGQPIDVYCRERNSTVRDCLSLLLQAAQAVTHAHAHLIVHRDLKPANILVDAGGKVHLLDFGIAKLLEAETGGESRFTQFAGRALTLDYASPEQIKGEPIGTASDVYSLAVVAYELLAGARPYALKHGSATELENAIAEIDPRPLSAMARNARRKTELRGDLDAVLNLALKKNPAERYATVDAFAQDLARYLRGEPVSARPDGFAYRAGKLIKRHRVTSAAASIALVAVIAGGAAALWQANEATAQARRAEAQAARAEQVKRFTLSLFEEADVDSGGNEKTTAADILRQAQRRIDTELSNDPATAVELLTSVGYSLVGLGEVDAAKDALTRALEIARAQLGDRHPLTFAANVVLAETLIDAGQLDAAERSLNPVIANDAGAPARTRADALRWLSDIRTKQGRYPDAMRLADEAARTAETLGSEDDRLRMELYINQVGGRKSNGNLQYTEPARKAYEISRKLYGDRPAMNAAAARVTYGIALADSGDLSAAIRELSGAIAQMVALGGAENGLAAVATSQLGIAQLESGDPLAAAATIRNSLDAYARAKTPPAERDVGVNEFHLGTALSAASRFTEAEPHLKAAVDRLSHSIGTQNRTTRLARSLHALTLARLGRIEEAETEFAAANAANSSEPLPLAGTLYRAQALQIQNRFPESAEILRPLLDSLRARPQDTATRLLLADAATASAAAALDAKDTPRAIALLTEARTIYSALQPKGSPALVQLENLRTRATAAKGS